jgi:hypothetical protein
MPTMRPDLYVYPHPYQTAEKLLAVEIACPT